MFVSFSKYIKENEDLIMDNILHYAQRQDYTKYTSVLKEAWRLSVSGLSESFLQAIQEKGGDLELTPDEDYADDAATQYGILQAHRHKERGVSLDMFLGLMKYYRQSYQDLIEASDFQPSEKKQYGNLLNRYFDRVEIGFCKTWTPQEQSEAVKQLQDRSRQMTNEKNKYLTIFESLSVPVFILAEDGRIENMNHFAASVFYSATVPGQNYYTEDKKTLYFSDEFPWMADIYNEFVDSNEPKAFYEKYLASKKKYFNISFSRFLDVTGRLAGTIVIVEDITCQKKLENELEELATTDPLTGAKNRRSFLRHFDQELTRSKRYRHPLALLMIDIDHFKKINDSHGHDGGDKVLKLLVHESLKVMRGSDRFGRWGGEEFVALLPETDCAQATAVAERLREKIGQAALQNEDGSSIKFTVSVGLTVVKDVMENPCSTDEIFKKVDEALYLAKNQGRNRVVRL